MAGDSPSSDSDPDSIDEGPRLRFEEEIRQFVEYEKEEERRQSARRESPLSLETYPGTEPVEYIFARERQNPYPANLIESTAHLIKGCMGAGILGMHEAFMRGGIWTSLVGTVFIGTLVSYIMLMVVKSTHKMYARIRVPRLSYPDLAEAAVATGPVKSCRRFSKIFRYTVDTYLFIETCGTCCLFELMIARTLKEGIENGFPEVRDHNLSERMYILIVTLPLLLLCLIKNLRCLAIASLISGIFVSRYNIAFRLRFYFGHTESVALLAFAICAFGTTVYGITTLEDIRQRPPWKDYHGLFRFIGTCVYSLQGVTITLPLENNMKSPQHFATVLQFGMVAVVSVVAAIGFFGYWSWGEQCQSPITIQLPHLISTVALQCFLSVMMSVTFAIHFWIAFRIFWHYIGRKHRRKHEIWSRIYRAILVILISCISVAIPDINTMMSFLGAVVCTCVEFIFPAIIDSLVTWRGHRKGRFRWRILRNICIMVFGCAISVGAIVSYIL